MLAGGNGRLIRRPSVVLFDPTGMNTDLSTRFDAAETDTDAVAELKQHLIDSGFNAGPLVVAQWGRGEFDLLVFGAVEVHTSAIAAPMVSGAGSGTWIERRLGPLEMGASTTVELWSGEAADPSTNLGLGIVACAGFRMSLDFADLGDEQQLLGSSTVEVPAAVGAQESAIEGHRAQAAPDPATAAPVDEATEWVPTEEPAPVAGQAPAAPPVPVAAPFDEIDHTDADRASDPFVAPAAVAEDPFTVADGEPPPVLPTAPVDQNGLVEAALCAQGHANPPRSTTCYICGQAVADDQSLSLIEQPTVGRILFSGGQGLALTRSVVMGRKPDHEQGRSHPVVIDHVEVSRAHAAITIQGWTVLLTDQASRNGTWVTPANDPSPVKLEANVPYVLEHGSIVHLGSPEVSFTYFFDDANE